MPIQFYPQAGSGKQSLVDRSQYLTDWQNFVQLYNSNIIQMSLAYNSVNQSILTGTSTALTFDTNSFDTGSPQLIHSTTTNTSRFTAPVNGLYVAICELVWAADGTGTVRQVQTLKNGSLATPVSGTSNAFFNATRAATCFTALPVSLNVADYLEFFAFNDSTNASVATNKALTYAALILLLRT